MTTTGAWEVLTREILKTGSRTIAYSEAWLVYWYVGVVVTFTTLTGGTETVLTERLDKTMLNILRWRLSAHSLKWITEALQIVSEADLGLLQHPNGVRCDNS